MINMFSYMACICHFVFMPFSEPPMGISGVGSFPVQSGGSLIFFQLFRFRNLALNRVFSYFLVAGMFLYLGECLDIPIFICPHTFVCLQGCTHPHMPPYSSVPLCFWRLCILLGLVMGFFLCWDTSLTSPLFWGASPLITPPHSVIGSLCIGMFQGYQYVMWAFPFC